jgi:hypothetical protein
MNEVIKMIIKCGRREFDLNENDEIMYNDACYRIVTRKYRKGWNELTPRIANAIAKKLIKEGKIVFKEKRKSIWLDELILDIYKITVQ